MSKEFLEIYYLGKPMLMHSFISPGSTVEPE